MEVQGAEAWAEAVRAAVVKGEVTVAADTGVVEKGVATVAMVAAVGAAAVVAWLAASLGGWVG